MSVLFSHTPVFFWCSMILASRYLTSSGSSLMFVRSRCFSSAFSEVPTSLPLVRWRDAEVLHPPVEVVELVGDVRGDLSHFFAHQFVLP